MQDPPAGSSAGADPYESPFAIPPVEGLPYPKDSDEARAIRRIIERGERADAIRQQG